MRANLLAGTKFPAPIGVSTGLESTTPLGTPNLFRGGVQTISSSFNEIPSGFREDGMIVFNTTTKEFQEFQLGLNSSDWSDNDNFTENIRLPFLSKTFSKDSFSTVLSFEDPTNNNSIIIPDISGKFAVVDVNGIIFSSQFQALDGEFISTVEGQAVTVTDGTDFSSMENRSIFSGLFKNNLFNLTDAATIVWSGYKQFAYVVIAGNRTIGDPPDKQPSLYSLLVRQDSVGGRTITWHSNFVFPSGFNSQPNAAANSYTSYLFQSINGVFRYVAGGAVQQTSQNPISTTGSANAYIITLSPVITSYPLSLTIKPNFTNTGAVTLNPNGLGAKAITKNGTTALSSGDLISGNFYDLAYDGTRYQIVGESSRVNRSGDTLTGPLVFNYDGLTNTIGSDGLLISQETFYTAIAAGTLELSAGAASFQMIIDADSKTISINSNSGGLRHLRWETPSGGGERVINIPNKAGTLAIVEETPFPILSTGSANAYIVTYSPAVISHPTAIILRPNFTNTGAATLNPNGLGAKAITKNGAIALEAGDLVANRFYSLAYDGVRYMIIGETGKVSKSGDTLSGNLIFAGGFGLGIDCPVDEILNIGYSDTAKTINIGYNDGAGAVNGDIIISGKSIQIGGGFVAFGLDDVAGNIGLSAPQIELNTGSGGNLLLNIVNYANDAAAAAAGLPVKGVYHTSGTLKIRLV